MLIDKDSVFNTVNFKKILKEIEKEEEVKINVLIGIKHYFHEDFIISFTDKYEEYFEHIKYKVYSNVKPNPTIKNVQDGVKECIKSNV